MADDSDVLKYSQADFHQNDNPDVLSPPKDYETWRNHPLVDAAYHFFEQQFVAAPRHVWIVPPQTLTTEIMSYGVRTLDVDAHDDVCIPGYEYHYIDEWEDPPALYSQIPEGFAGAASEVDPSRADVSPWNERLPVIREFRRKVPLPWKAPRVGSPR